MAREDEPLDDEPGRLTHVIYNTTLGHVRVRAEDGPATTVEIPPGEVRFRRVLGAEEPEVALWLGSGEREYLGRMLEHVLRALRITPEAREALQAIETKLGELGPPPFVADDGADSAAAAAAIPLVEESIPAAPAPVETPPARRDPRGRWRAAPPPPPAAETLDVEGAEPGPAALGDDATAATGGGPAWSAAEDEDAGSVTDDGPAPDAVTPSPSGLNGNLLAPGAADELLAASQAAFAAALEADSGGRAVTFEQVWRDLTALQARGPALQTLVGQASSEIREVAEDGIWLYMQQLGRHHLIERRALETAWGALVRRGALVSRELRGGMSYGAATLLAHLPYVEYSAQPLTLYYPASTPHPLGTVHRREGT